MLAVVDYYYCHQQDQAASMANNQFYTQVGTFFGKDDKASLPIAQAWYSTQPTRAPARTTTG